ncbi:hypothetical protein DYB37_005068 [Aphanomyces astaci]|uniref:RRM domain-containing protein n=2 Tax=Aphanomyces astaci TaxID=112090 RepID=A0A397AGY9_APHAT|nr:hypothetical protein DYB36_009245 [Aphanomyces astaci]RHY52412.1 hypothetical protein DYB34_001733 [Aphanomyces astaci]RHZ20565.1 hypothetical protein DYB37_005068 [Aphanomyces astaci]
MMSFGTKSSTGSNNEGRSVYVGNVPSTWTVADVRTALATCGPIERVHMVKDRNTKEFRGFAFVEFVDTIDATNAVEFGETLGKHRLVVRPAASTSSSPSTKSPRDSSTRTSSSSKSSSTTLLPHSKDDTTPTVYFGNLPHGGSTDDVVSLFAACGPIRHVHVVKDSVNQSRGYGSVEFEDVASVTAALALGGRTDVATTERNRPLIVKRPHQTKIVGAPSTVVLVKSLAPDTTVEAVAAAISATGANVAHVHLHKDKHTKQPKGTGYVILHDTESMKKATSVRQINDHDVRVVIAQDIPGMAKTLYLGNLPTTATEDDVRDLFSSCGPIYQVRLAQRPGSPRVYAHVQFASGASLAAARRINAPTIGGKKLFVQVALDE